MAKDGRQYLNEQGRQAPDAGHRPRRRRHDADHLDYELYSNWDYNPATNAQFVGRQRPHDTFTGNAFPATPGMVQMVQSAHDPGYAIFFITGRGDSQHQPTIANLDSDTAAGYRTPLRTTVTSQRRRPCPSRTSTRAIRRRPTPVRHRPTAEPFTDGLFTKPRSRFIS